MLRDSMKPSESISTQPATETSRTQVCVRLRPGSRADKPFEHGVVCSSDTKVVCDAPDSDDSNVFLFDRAFDQGATQRDVYRVVQPVVQGVLDGVNGTVLAYGQTGSGKTHTLIGDLADEDTRGIAPRAAEELMGAVRAKSDPSVFVAVSAAEIYCERIFDLLRPANADLQVKQSQEKGIHIAGLSEMEVKDETELNDAMQRAIANRTVSGTAMNQQSSRSHCIINIWLGQHTDKDTVTNDQVLSYDRLLLQAWLGKLCMVDLAGSERQSKTGTSGLQMEEGILINKSLSALASVICSLTESKSRHVPYRDSKLTRVLQDSLGGNSRTALIVCCSPSRCNLNETLCSLRFGSRARGIANTIQPKAHPTSVEQQLVKWQEECRELRMELEKLKMGTSLETGVAFRGLSRMWMGNGRKKRRRVVAALLCLLHFSALVLMFVLEDFWFPRR